MTRTTQNIPLGGVDDLLPDLAYKHNPNYPGRNVVLLGSFKNGNWERIKQVRETFQRLGFFVLAPEGERIVRRVGRKRAFEILDHDLQKIERIRDKLGPELSDEGAAGYIEAVFMTAIRAADLCYLVGAARDDIDDGTYMGNMVATEMGLAMGLRKPVIASEAISRTLDEREGWVSMFSGYAAMAHVASPEVVAEVIGNGKTFISKNGLTTLS